MKSKWEMTTPGFISPSLKALMSVYGQCPAMPLAGNGGIARPEDVIKILLAGADVAMIVSAVHREGPDVIRTMLDGLTQFMKSNQLSSLNELQSRRPLEFSNDEDRLSLIQGLTARSDQSRASACENLIQADRWGHPMPSRR